MVPKRPQIAARSKQQAHAASPPTGPSAAPKELAIIECLDYTLVYLQKKIKIYYAVLSSWVNKISVRFSSKYDEKDGHSYAQR